MKPLIQSPSDKDRIMSQKLSTKKSMTNIHADLPFGTPPYGDINFSLTNVSMLEDQARRRSRRRAVTASNPRSSTSDDTFSVFSCEGVFPEAPNHTMHADTNGAGDDLVEIERIANVLARRRHVDPARVIPQLLDLFGTQHTVSPDRLGGLTNATPNVSGINTSPLKHAPSVKVIPENAIAKRQTIRSKASGFLQKLKPQLGVDTTNHSRSAMRRFSFEPGDDAVARSAADQNALYSNSNERVLRKSFSLDALKDKSPNQLALEQPLSPVAGSPTNSTPTVDGLPTSRIPTPVYRSGSLAKPRQQREDSASSLLTAIKHSEDGGIRCNSLSSSVYSSPPESPANAFKLSPSTELDSRPSCRSSNSNRLLDHTNALRRTSRMISMTAARTASTSSETDCNLAAHWKQTGARRQHSGYSNPSQMSDNRRENVRPMSPGMVSSRTSS